MEEILRRILESAVTGFAGDQVMERTGLGKRASGILDKIIPPAAAADASAIPQERTYPTTTSGQSAQTYPYTPSYMTDPQGNQVDISAPSWLPQQFIDQAEQTKNAMTGVNQLPTSQSNPTSFIQNVSERTKQLLSDVPEQVQTDPNTAQAATAAATVETILKNQPAVDLREANFGGTPDVPPSDTENNFNKEADKFVTDNFLNEEFLLNLALGFNSMRLTPDQGLAAVIGKRLETLQTTRGGTATIAELVKMGRSDLARLVKAGQITAKEALTMALKQPKTSWSTMSGAELKQKFPGQFSQYADDEMFNVSSQGEIKPLYAEPIGKTMGTEAAKASIETVTPIYQNALTAPRAVENLDRTISIIKNQPINSGLFLDLKNMRDKLLTEFGSKDAVERLTWTQIANSRLGSEVFQLFKALGLGARGMDTPAEREFMREVLTGNLSMTPQALIELAKSRRETQLEAMRTYNMFSDSPAMKQYSSGLVSIPKFDLSKYAPVVTPAMMGK